MAEAKYRSNNIGFQSHTHFFFIPEVLEFIIYHTLNELLLLHLTSFKISSIPVFMSNAVAEGEL